MGETTEQHSDSIGTGTTGTTAVADRVPLGASAVAGVGAYLLGYLLTYLTQSGAVRERVSGLNVLVDLFGGEPVAVWQGVGWYFYNAHFVSTVVPSFGGTRTVDLIASADANLAYLYVLPPLALLAAGAAGAFLADAAEATDGAVAAVGVVPAYFLLAVGGAFVFAYGGGDAGSVHPEYVTAALLAGLVYPVVFGGIGGALGGVVGGE